MGLEKINEFKKQKGLTNAQLAQMTGLTISTVDKITSGYNTNPKLGTVEAICKAVGCTISDLLGENPNNTAHTILKYSSKEDNIIKKYRELDIHGKDMVDTVIEKEYERCTYIEETEEPKIEIRYSLLSVSAGSGILLGEESTEIREFPDTPEARRADIVIPVTGRSMEPMFYDGDELYVRLQPDIEIGEIGIFVMEDNGYVKEKGEDRLISLNPDYEDIYPNGYDTPRCLGKVIGKVE